MHRIGSQKFLEIRAEMLWRRAEGQTIRQICFAMGFKSSSAYYYYTQDYKVKVKSKSELIQCLREIQKELLTGNDQQKIIGIISTCLD